MYIVPYAAYEDGRSELRIQVVDTSGKKLVLPEEL